ncbi:MAG: hypothetical protein U0031_07535 [Thermomicrobiales bacterium]
MAKPDDSGLTAPDPTLMPSKVSSGETHASQPEPSSSRQLVTVRDPVIQIRPYHLADIPGVMRLPGKIRLDLPDSLVMPESGAIDLPAALPVLRRQRPTFVALADTHPIGFVRFSPRRPDGRWVLSGIAASTGVFSPEPVWDALLAHGVRAAGLRGVRRLFARIPAGHQLQQTLQEANWIPYAHETIYRADRLVLQPATGARRQEPADTWAIHQLHATACPRKVQEVEALTSHFWHMDRTGRKRSRRGESGWLIERAGQLTGYARYTWSPRAGMVDVVVCPGEFDLFGTLLDISLAHARRSGRPVFCALRSYFSEFDRQLQNRGFVPTGEQELFIRYTTAAARVPAHETLTFPIELRPAVPRRVPTFLEGQQREGMV